MTPGTSSSRHVETGERIRKLRHETGIGQELFAEYVGVTRRHLSRLETGARGPSQKLAERIEAFVEKHTGQPAPVRILEAGDAPFHAGGK